MRARRQVLALLADGVKQVFEVEFVGVEVIDLNFAVNDGGAGDESSLGLAVLVGFLGRGLPVISCGLSGSIHKVSMKNFYLIVKYLYDSI